MVPEPSSQEPDPDQSLPSGLSWSSVSDPPASQRDTGGQEGEAGEGGARMFQRLSPRILLTLHSPPLSPAPASRASFYVPQQVTSIVYRPLLVSSS